MSVQTDVSDVRASLESGDPGFVLIDSRGTAGWEQGHVPGAVHLPTADIPARAAGLLDPAVPVITYCWGLQRRHPLRAGPVPARLPGQGDDRRHRVLDPRGRPGRDRFRHRAARTGPADR